MYLLVLIGVPFKLSVFSLYAALIYLAVTTFSFYINRTYAGIIRHSSFEDAVRLFYALSFSFVILFIINGFYNLFNPTNLVFSNLALFNGIVSAWAFLLLYRIIVKKGYDFYLQSINPNKKINVLIYGIDSHSIATVQVINADYQSKYRVVGFVTKSLKARREKNFLLSLPVQLITKPIPVLLRYYKAQGIIIPQTASDQNSISKIVDDCISHNYKVFSASTVKSFDNSNKVTGINHFDIIDLLGRDAIKLDKTAIEKNTKGKTILITGAAGSIGSEIVRQVISYQPQAVVLLDFAESALHDLYLEISAIASSNINIYPVISDIRDFKSLEFIFEKYMPNYVYHAAAYKHVPLMEENPDQAINTNVFGTKNIADLSLKYGIEKFVMVSTDKAVNPSNVMGASKRIAEKYIQALAYTPNVSTKFITTRFGNVLGSNGSVVPLFQKQIKQGGPLTITHPDVIRYFMTISEACQLVLEAGAMGKGGEIFLFDMGEPVKIIDLAHKMILLAGYEPEKDIKTKIIGLRPGEKLYEELLTNTSRSIETYNKKITIAVDTYEDYDEIFSNIEKLRILLTNNSKRSELVTQMKYIVPEFKSQNSSFCNLDVK
jgi:FlaA1/EpsC-like NDP-sugar epimerase